MDIVLATLNAKYIHASFGLRYLLANLGPLRPRAALAEFDIHQRPLEIVEALLAHEPRVVGLGIYIWNVTQTTEVVAALKRVRPDLIVVLGGPEVSFETDSQPVVGLADYVITGEADLAFAQLCDALLKGERPATKIIPAALPTFDQLALPYEFYTPQDIAHRVIYVEASRGCPFRCEFCLSSLDIPVRQAPWPALRQALDDLLARGARHLKFVDRTFNLNLQAGQAILQFCLERRAPGRFFHFEMIPDRLPEPLREIIARFPPGALQFEVGVQSFNPEVCARISRRQDAGKLEDNFHFLRAHTGVHLHADLIIGLPGETLASFAAGFDRLIALGPHEIQVGILKRLRGTPIGRHDAEWQMVYNPNPPYDILQNKLLDFPTMQRLRRFARYWDLVGNSGNFLETTPLLWTGACPWATEVLPLPIRWGEGRGEGEADGVPPTVHSSSEASSSPSPFASLLHLSDWLYAQVGRTDSIALPRLAELLFNYLTQELSLPPANAAQTLLRDFQRAGRREQPACLQPFLSNTKRTPRDMPPSPPQPRGSRRKEALTDSENPAICPTGLKRQARHRAALKNPDLQTLNSQPSTLNSSRAPHG